MGSTALQPLQRQRNVAKLLALLEARGQRLEPSVRGTRGAAETAADVAAALGMASRGGSGARLAVAVLCLRLWPSQYAPGGRSMAAMLGLIERFLRGRMARRPPPPAVAARALQPAFMERWAQLVVDEYRKPNHCQACHGFGETMKVSTEHRRTRATITPCEHCHGAGVVPWSKDRRAKALRIGKAPYRIHLDERTADALGLLRTLEYRGARAVLASLGIEE